MQVLGSALAVSNYFGPLSNEYAAAQVYFSGFTGCTKYPASMLFAQYNGATAVSAYLQSGNVLAGGLPALQAITSGTLTLTVDGYARTIAALNLSAATSFSSAAGLIQTALTTPTVATFTGSITTTVLTVATLTTGSISPGQTVTGGTTVANTQIVAQLTGTPGGAGTYTVSISQSVTSGSLTCTATPCTVTFDSVSGGFLVTSGVTGVASTMAYATGTLATKLQMTAATSALISQGAAATTPGAFMDNIVQNVTQNWASFTTVQDPDGGTGNTLKLAFAAWANAQNNRYLYVAWDTDQSPTVSANATGSFGYLIGTNGSNYSGTIPIWDSTALGGLQKAAFVCGFGASLDFAAYNGRATLAFKSQNGLVATVTTKQVSDNLDANGYNYYAAVGTANQNFLFISNGVVSGPFLWADSFFNEIWLNNNLQLALMNLLTLAKSIPYNSFGYAMVESSMQDPVNQAVNFGAIRSGIVLSQQQINYVNSTTGKQVDQVIAQRGFYISIQDPGPQVRAQRGTPVIFLFYSDGQSIQRLVVNSLSVL